MKRPGFSCLRAFPAASAPILALVCALVCALACAHSPGTAPGSTAPAPFGPKETLMNLSYGDGPAHKLDLYLPARSGKALPLVVLLHGGGWVDGSRQDCAYTAQAFVAEGYAAAAVEYRMIFKGAPIRADDILDDIDAAVSWLRSHAGEHGLDGRYALDGWSAGGHLSLLHGFTRKDPSGKPSASCIVDFFGPADFSLPAYSEESREPLLRELMGGSFSEAPDAWRKASPISWVSASAPPTLIFHGQKDPIVPWEDSRDLAGALRERGATVSLILYPDGGHGDPAFDWGASWRSTMDWLAKWMPL